MNERYKRIIGAYEAALARRAGGELCIMDVLLAIFDDVPDAAPEEIVDVLLPHVGIPHFHRR